MRGTSASPVELSISPEKVIYIIVKARECDAKVDPAFRADSIESAAKVSTSIRTFGHAQAEIRGVRIVDRSSSDPDAHDDDFDTRDRAGTDPRREGSDHSWCLPCAIGTIPAGDHAPLAACE